MCKPNIPAGIKCRPPSKTISPITWFGAISTPRNQVSEGEGTRCIFGASKIRERTCLKKNLNVSSSPSEEVVYDNYFMAKEVVGY